MSWLIWALRMRIQHIRRDWVIKKWLKTVNGSTPFSWSSGLPDREIEKMHEFAKRFRVKIFVNFFPFPYKINTNCKVKPNQILINKIYVRCPYTILTYYFLIRWVSFYTSTSSKHTAIVWWQQNSAKDCMQKLGGPKL